METKMTIQEVLQDSVNSINNISLPVALSHVATELARVSKNLHACLVYMNEQAAKANPTSTPSESTEGENAEESGEQDG